MSLNNLRETYYKRLLLKKKLFASRFFGFEGSNCPKSDYIKYNNGSIIAYK